MTNIAILLAGGAGSRFGTEVPKQLAPLAGRPVLQHAIEAFERHPRIHEIVVVSRAEQLETVQALVFASSYAKVTQVVPGGATRPGSVLAGLAALAGREDETKLLVHDAVRPLVSRAIIDRCLDALDEAGAVEVVVSSTDTMVEVDEAGFVRGIPDRSRLRRCQTPEAFRLGVLRRAYAILGERGELRATCDGVLVLRALPSERVATVEGEAANLKITEPVDLELAEMLLRARGKLS